MFACTLSDILESFCNVETLIMGDVTYGACCVDDYTAKALECDFMVKFWGWQKIDHCRHNSICCCYSGSKKTFGKGLFFICTTSKTFISWRNIGLHITKIRWTRFYNNFFPWCLLFRYLGDGRFHLESIMIANPDIPAFRYDPYSKKFTRERYDHAEMHSLRKHAIDLAKKAKKFGLILGTLGRQGSPKVLEVFIQVSWRKNKIMWSWLCLHSTFRDIS